MATYSTLAVSENSLYCRKTALGGHIKLGGLTLLLFSLLLSCRFPYTSKHNRTKIKFCCFFPIICRRLPDYYYVVWRNKYRVRVWRLFCFRSSGCVAFNSCLWVRGSSLFFSGEFYLFQYSELQFIVISRISMKLTWCGRYSLPSPRSDMIEMCLSKTAILRTTAVAFVHVWRQLLLSPRQPKLAPRCVRDGR